MNMAIVNLLPLGVSTEVTTVSKNTVVPTTAGQPTTTEEIITTESTSKTPTGTATREVTTAISTISHTPSSGTTTEGMYS